MKSQLVLNFVQSDKNYELPSKILKHELPVTMDTRSLVFML